MDAGGKGRVRPRRGAVAVAEQGTFGTIQNEWVREVVVGRRAGVTDFGRPRARVAVNATVPLSGSNPRRRGRGWS